MALTPAQKAAAEKAKNEKLLEEAKIMLADRKAKLSQLEEIAYQNALQARGKARTTAAKKDAEYMANLENPIISQYDPRIQINAGINPEMADAGMYGRGQTPEEAAAAKAAADAKTAADAKAAADKILADKKAAEEAAAAKAKYDEEQAAIAAKAAAEAEKRDAFALVQDTMRSYGFTDAELKELSTYIESSIIDPNVGPNSAILGMRNLGVYKARFAGNEALVKAGKNALSEYDYLQQENAYDQYFKAYGVGNLSTREQKATLIGNAVSALEAKERIGIAVDRVKNADTNIAKQLKTFFPTLNDQDLVSYFLNPVQALPELKRKVTASEIGAAALGQGFTDTSRALGLADYGIDRAGALEGYANLANVLPTTSKLGDIYGEAGIKYTQQTGEEEFLQSSEAAKRKRNILASKERASFEGSAGNAPGAYSTSYLKKSSAAGQI